MATAARMKIEHVRCKLCGSRIMYQTNSGSSKPRKCNRCGNLFSDAKLLSIHDESASLSTHYMVRWGCRSCKHYGTKWVPRGENLMYCPNCEVDRRSSGMWVTKIDPSGSCDTIWEPVEGITRPLIRTKLSKKKHHCGNCGYTHSYLIRYPTVCPRCGDTW